MLRKLSRCFCCCFTFCDLVCCCCCCFFVLIGWIVLKCVVPQATQHKAARASIKVLKLNCNYLLTIQNPIQVSMALCNTQTHNAELLRSQQASKQTISNKNSIHSTHIAETKTKTKAKNRTNESKRRKKKQRKFDQTSSNAN